MDKTVYDIIDIDGLATCLAEIDWKDTTKNKTDEDLYDSIVQPDGSIEKIIKGHWAHEFFAMKEVYLHLIAHFRKDNKENEDETGKKGRNNI
jgi:hypothetical protein